MNKHPLISIIIPTLNEERNIDKCLTSIFNQNYPKNKLEVIIVDDLSKDRTLEIAKKYPVKILISGKKHAEISKMLGFKAAKGELALYLDADIELRGRDWLSKMVEPLADAKIIGSFTKYYSNKSDPAIERYLCFDPLQRDSIYQFFSPSIESTVIRKIDDFYICEYREGKIPPAGLCLYRRMEVLKLVSSYNMFLELDFLVLLVRNGYNRFAYVPDAGLFHHHATTLIDLVRKRKYNLNKVYLGRAVRFYKWFDLSSLSGFLKVGLWIFYVNLIIPSLFVGLIKSIKYRDWVGLYEPLVNVILTDIFVFEFLKNSKGRALFSNS
ncbi:MAG: glycosyltransferase family 2 protein [Candidatus Daviesbacteria bacterium]|nr:glycosyltransferase family 2 protein [Candidatus Daviesbacteria bacterium]